MDLDELQSVQSRERQTDSLQQLRATFYQDAAEFIQSLEQQRDRAAEHADDPWNSPEVGRLNDDIDTAEQTVEAIYERRVGKIVKMASLAAADMPTEDDGLTDEERDLFDTLVTAIQENREDLFAILDGDGPTVPPTGEAGGATAPADGPDAGPAGDAVHPTDGDPDAAETGTTARESRPSSAEPHPDDVDPNESEPGDAAGGLDKSDDSDAADDEPSVDASDVMGGADDTADVRGPASEGPRSSGLGDERDDDSATDGGRRPASEGAGDRSATDADGGPDVVRTRVKITDDVGEIFGVDERAYDLTTDDVVTLPEANAAPLLDSGAAEPLE